ncbi:hypothetical protein [Flaviaesturariibacter amylovorans]
MEEFYRPFACDPAQVFLSFVARATMKDLNKKTPPTAAPQIMIVPAEMRAHPALLRLKEKLKSDLARKDGRLPA